LNSFQASSITKVVLLQVIPTYYFSNLGCYHSIILAFNCVDKNVILVYACLIY
jgi:hypothetical protein